MKTDRVRIQVDGYDTYEQYLDSLVSEEDHHYLDDEEMARCIAELGYRYATLRLEVIKITDCNEESRRSSGDTLTRENFYKTKARLAEKRMLTRKSPTGTLGIADRSGVGSQISELIKLPVNGN